ncbi:hypothetical protein G7Z17_g6187 [Cylindrodendrum hubeiense]|uniref:Peptidase C14 caspase domain-containing protein n=1 Tax=Cylindrodendrum hubeiense TaxID=595255 RepID=A0A9P5LFG3_9HYPO|nr:hypothetical protein G7Z17_g6187 [Cylindrodendrum hubeiense]
MDRPGSQRRFALLVGIDLYLKNGANENRDRAIHDLKGCVNDVNAVNAVLQERFQVEHTVVLTSSTDTTTSGQFRQPKESPDYLPTYANIKREFDAVTTKANPGDIFFFQYSGHGGRLRKTVGSPAGRQKDPSLLTADFCLNKPPVRGWELNGWLKRLDKKHVQVIVVLDSCYSGGSWRGDHRGRTPLDWEDLKPPNDDLTQQETTHSTTEPATEPTIDSGFRNSELEKSWSINPDSFTLMAACQPNQLAKEIKVNGKSHGAFTYELVKLLEQSQPHITPSTYCVLRDKIAERLESHKQNPEVFGRDRLAFFENFEPFLSNPLVSQVEGNEIIVPMGKVHGIHPGTEFAQVPLSHEVVFKVSKIKDRKCHARILSGFLQKSQYSLEVVPSKWGLGREMFRVYVDESLGDKFQMALYEKLEKLLAGSIEVEEFSRDSTPGKEKFILARRGVDGVEISGPSSLIGYEGPLRCLELKGSGTLQLAARSAAALGHLARFRQILDLPREACQDCPPFTSSLTRVASPADPKIKMKFVFTNTGESDLYLTVLSLHPGFGVRQIYPGSRSREGLRQGKSMGFTMEITFPKEIRSNEAAEPTPQRDIIRVIVARGEDVSWRSLELPDIWQVDQVESKAQSGSGRDVKTITDDLSWWMTDHVIHSSPL